MVKTKSKKAPKGSKPAEAAVEAEVVKKKKKKKPEVVVEVEDDDDEDGDAEDEVIEEVVNTAYVASMSSMAILTKAADTDAALVKRLSTMKEVSDERGKLLIQHARHLIDSAENSTLALGEALYDIRANGYWKLEKDADGKEFTKMEDVWRERLGISPATGFRAIKLYDVLVVRLELAVEDIEPINLSVWRQVLDVINEENYDEVRAAIEGMTAREAEAFAKSAKRIGLEEAIAHKDDEDDLPEGGAVSDGDNDGDTDGSDEAEEAMKTIKVVCVESTYNLFFQTLTNITALLPTAKGENAQSVLNKALVHLLMEYNNNCFEIGDQIKDVSEYVNLQIKAMEDAYGVSLTEDDEDEDEDEDE